MKALLFLIILSGSFAFGQTDTQWETFVNGNKGVTLYYRFVVDEDSKTMETKFFIFKGLTDLPFTVSEEQRFILIFDNGQSVELKNIRYTETCIGCGSVGLSGSNALGAKTYYSLNDEQISLILNNRITSFKLYTDDNNYQINVKPKSDSQLKKWITQIQ